jgi:hypothetical protein
MLRKLSLRAYHLVVGKVHKHSVLTVMQSDILRISAYRLAMLSTRGNKVTYNLKPHAFALLTQRLFVVIILYHFYLPSVNEYKKLNS